VLSGLNEIKERLTSVILVEFAIVGGQAFPLLSSWAEARQRDVVDKREDVLPFAVSSCSSSLSSSEDESILLSALTQIGHPAHRPRYPSAHPLPPQHSQSSTPH
jgi:hypothetical protein